MSVQEFDSQEELDEEFERIAEVNFRHLELKNEVKDKRRELHDAEAELKAFEEDNADVLLP